MARPRVIPSLFETLEALRRVRIELERQPDADTSAVLKAIGQETRFRELAVYLGMFEEHYKVKFLQPRHKTRGNNRLTPEADRILAEYEKRRDEILGLGGDGSVRPPEEVRVGVFNFSFIHAVVPLLRDLYAAWPGAAAPRLTFREFFHPEESLDALLKNQRHPGYVACVFATETDLVKLDRYANAVEFLSGDKKIYPRLIWPASWEQAPTLDTLDNFPVVLPHVVPKEWSAFIPAPNEFAGGRQIEVGDYSAALAMVRSGLACSVFPGIFRGCLSDPAIRADVQVGAIREDITAPIDFGIYRWKNVERYGTDGERHFIEHAARLLRASRFDTSDEVAPGRKGGSR